MFQKGTKDQEKLPPSRKCLEQHIKRAHHQAQVWFQADVPIPEIESPIGSGWYEDATRRLHPHVSVDDPLPNEFTDILLRVIENWSTYCWGGSERCVQPRLLAKQRKPFVLVGKAEIDGVSAMPSKF
ncbi:hypothetical protein GWK47_023254 [Chionoecetes opilio]|uniref:Uncharacterized protein n=1 Tax=Chionoecetes opilio TaxID=41210 RepID=A0A8J4XWE0_CHIOP|nr:hypothetical protein GWK47_023254 [Chionoecetes opilio]